MIIQFFLAMLGTLGFAVLFHAPARYWIYCGLAGGAGWLVNILLLQNGFAPALACFAATFALTALARLFSYRLKAPVTVFLIVGLLPLVPGAGLYYTAYYAFSADFSMALSKGMETLMISGVIVMGILFGSAIPQKLFTLLLRLKP